MREVRPKENPGELLLIDVKDVGGNLNELRKGCITIWLRYNCTLYEAKRVVAVTRSWAEQPPNAFVPTCTVMRTLLLVANVCIEKLYQGW